MNLIFHPTNCCPAWKKSINGLSSKVITSTFLWFVFNLPKILHHSMRVICKKNKKKMIEHDYHQFFEFTQFNFCFLLGPGPSSGKKGVVWMKCYFVQDCLIWWPFCYHRRTPPHNKNLGQILASCFKIRFIKYFLPKKSFDLRPILVGG